MMHSVSIIHTKSPARGYAGSAVYSEKQRPVGRVFLDAEGERFELSVPDGTVVFETTALDLYATPP